MDEVLITTGGFGNYQKKRLIIFGLISVVTAMFLYADVFTLAKPELICTIKNSTYTDEKETCSIWSNLTEITISKNDTYECHTDKTYYDKTIATDWNLFCNKEYLVKLLETFYMLGGLSGIFSGYFGDRFGRKRNILTILLSICCFGLISALIQTFISSQTFTLKYSVFSILQFILGACGFSLYVSTYVLLLELNATKYHVIVSNIYLFSYVFGELVVLTVSYFFRDWIVITWFVAGITVPICIFALILLPESPAWLISNKRYKDAGKILLKIARANKKKIDLDENSFNTINDDESFYEMFQNRKLSKTINIEYLSGATTTDDDQTPIIDEGIFDEIVEKNFITIFKEVFYGRKKLIKIILLSYIWFAANLLYFGISLGITSIDGNPYVLYLSSSVAEVIGYSLCFLNYKIGHRKSNMIYLSLASLACLSLGIIMNTNISNNKTLHSAIILIVSAIGKCMASASFNTMFILSSEMYPTSVLNFVLLFLSSIGCIGSIISPEINLLADLIWKPVPFFIFSGAAFLSVLSMSLTKWLKH